MTAKEFDKLIDMIGSEYFYEKVIKPNTTFVNREYNELNGWTYYEKGDYVDDEYVYLIITAEENGLMQSINTFKDGKWENMEGEEHRVLYYKEFVFVGNN